MFFIRIQKNIRINQTYSHKLDFTSES